MLNKYGFAISDSQQKVVKSEKLSFIDAIEFGEYIYGVDLAKSNYSDLKLYADESYGDIFECIKNKYPLETVYSNTRSGKNEQSI